MRAERIDGVARRVAETRLERRKLGRLVSLSDRELADKGLSRGDLTRVFDADFTGFSRRV